MFSGIVLVLWVGLFTILSTHSMIHCLGQPVTTGGTQSCVKVYSFKCLIYEHTYFIKERVVINVSDSVEYNKVTLNKRLHYDISPDVKLHNFI